MFIVLVVLLDINFYLQQYYLRYPGALNSYMRVVIATNAVGSTVSYLPLDQWIWNS